MLRYIYLLAISFSVHINSDIFVSSPKIKLNADQQRLIELKIENTKISDSDVTLFKYKTNELIDTFFLLSIFSLSPIKEDNPLPSPFFDLNGLIMLHSPLVYLGLKILL